ncbi:MAG: efflux RND transporter periplasmic adaptor subunit [Bacteroidetes bacterium]|nr:efflux RND transporter periplasmic adaptor subunit [Bacteroidota bacterium]
MLVAACSQDKQGESDTAERAVMVKTERIKKQMVTGVVHSFGILSTKTQAKLSFKTGGIIQRICAEEGEKVHKGQVLAQLNMSEIQAQVNQASEAFEKAGRDHKRAEKLLADSLITLELFQNAGSALEIARNNKQIADFNLRYSTITAPADGKILKRLYEENEVIAPGYPVFLFGSTGAEWVVKTNVTDKDIVDINTGDSAVARFDAYPGERFRSEITEAGTMADPYTGTYEVEVCLREMPAKPVSGLIARVEIYKSTGDELYLIPVDALVEADRERARIFIARNDTAQGLRLRIKAITDKYLMVSEGVDTTMEVVVSGGGYLEDGCLIQIRN